MGNNRQIQHRLTAAYDKFNKSADQVASQKAFVRPSDDPVAASQASLLQERLDHLDAVGRSADDALARLNVTDAKLTQIGDSYNRIRELMLQAANGTMSSDSRGAIASELAQIRDGIVAVANSEYLGLPLFAGLSADPAVDGEPGDWTLQGDADTGRIERRISPSESIRVNVTAGELFANDDGDLFSFLDSMIDDLTTGDGQEVVQGLDTIDGLRSTLFEAHASIGAAANRADTAVNRNAATSISIENQLSLIRDVDLAEAITRQTMLQTAYEAALSVTGKTMGLSIMDFLR
ncbi:MAG: flagellin [Ilumatobacteraceae bacterium]